MLVSGQQQLKALTNQLKEASEQAEALNQKTESIKAAGRRSRTILSATGRDQPRGPKGQFAKDPDRQLRLSALRQERENFKEFRAARRTLQLKKLAVTETENQVRAQKKVNKENVKQLETQAQIDKTVELFNTRLAKFQRSRPLETKSNVQEVQRLRNAGEQLQQAFAVAKKGGQENLRLLKTLADALGKLVEKQNELNRASKLASQGFERGRALQERVDSLAQSGLVGAPRLKAARGLAGAVIDAGNVGDATKYAKAVGKAEALIRRTEKEIQKIEKGLNSVTSTQRTLNSLKEQELVDQKAVGRIQAKLDKARQEALKGNVKAAKKLTQEVKDELQTQRNITRELNKQKKAKDTKSRQKAAGRGRFAGNLASAVGFPLLFGGGVGSVAGGAIGTIAGSLLGPGGAFGGAILGSSIGQQFDTLAESTLNLARAFQNTTDGLEDIVRSLGTETPEGFKGRASFLASQGFGAQAGLAASQEFEAIYGSEAARKIRELADTTREWDRLIAELGTELQLFLSGPLKGLLEAIKRVTGRGEPDKQGLVASRDRAQTRADDLLPEIEALRAIEKKSIGEKQRLNELETKRVLILSTVKQYNEDIEQSKKNQTQSGQDILNIEKLTNQVLRDRKAVDDAATDAVRQQLTARRDNLALLQSEANILKLTQNRNRIKAELAVEKEQNENSQRAIQLQDELNRANAALTQAQLSRNNALVRAQRAISREEFSNLAAAERARIQINATLQEGLGIQDTGAKYYERTVANLKTQLKANIDLLEARKQQELVGKNELEVIDSIITKYDQLITLEQTRTALKLEQKKQNELARLDSEQQFKNELALQKLQSKNQTEAFIRQTSPETIGKFQFKGFGFFDQSVALEDDLLKSRTAQIAEYTTELNQLNLRIQELSQAGADPKGRLGDLIKERDALQQTKELYEQLQPAKDAAALAQQRYNEALAVTTPIAQSLVNELREVVAGTKSAQEAFAAFLRVIAEQFFALAARMLAQYAALAIARNLAFGGTSGGGGGVAQVLTSGLDFSGAFADGGRPAVGKAALVGERGPELFVPNRSGTIIPNDQLGGSSNTVTVNVDAKGTEVSGNSDQSRQLGTAISRAVQAELVKQQRPGGVLHSSR